MPIFFLFVGVLLIASAINNKTSELYNLVKADFTGQDSFTVWILAFLGIGMLGYVKSIRPVSNAFLVLLILVILLANDKGQSGGFFAKFAQALNLTGTDTVASAQISQEQV